MIYERICQDCERLFTVDSPMKLYNEPGTSYPCVHCDSRNTISYISSVKLVAGVQGMTHKLPGEFKEIHNRIKKANRGSNLPTL